MQSNPIPNKIIQILDRYNYPYTIGEHFPIYTYGIDLPNNNPLHKITIDIDGYLFNIIFDIPFTRCSCESIYTHNSRNSVLIITEIYKEIFKELQEDV